MSQSELTTLILVLKPENRYLILRHIIVAPEEGAHGARAHGAPPLPRYGPGCYFKITTKILLKFLHFSQLKVCL